MRKLLKKQGYAPDVLVTDKLGSYASARRELRLSARHDQGLRKNNRAENSHQAVRRRERKMLASNRPDQLSASSACMPQSTTPSHSSAISSPAAPCASSGQTPLSNGSTPPQHDPGLRDSPVASLSTLPSQGPSSRVSVSDGHVVDRDHGTHPELALEAFGAHEECLAPSKRVTEFELFEVVSPVGRYVQCPRKSHIVRSWRSRPAVKIAGDADENRAAPSWVGIDYLAREALHHHQ